MASSSATNACGYGRGVCFEIRPPFASTVAREDLNAGHGAYIHLRLTSRGSLNATITLDGSSATAGYFTDAGSSYSADAC